MCRVGHNTLEVWRASPRFWPRRKIPPPSVLDGKAGGRSRSEVPRTSSAYKRSGRTVRAVGLPSPRNPAKKLKQKQRALVVVYSHQELKMRSATSLVRSPNGMRASSLLGMRLRTLREQKGFSQGDLEERTGLLRCYISSVEHSHTVPSVDTLDRIARALEVPLHSLFCDCAEARLRMPRLAGRANPRSEEDRRFLRLLRRHVCYLNDQHRSLLLFLVRTMARTASAEKARNGR
jgi:transcriptional regulator with XRE-family HTH domain